MLEDDINSMYEDITSYGGSFGDGVDTRSINPIELLNKRSANIDIEGVGVALLVWLETAIDNSTQEDAVSHYRKDLRKLLHDGVFQDYPSIFFAALAFFESETRFTHELQRVYHEIVKPRTEAFPKNG